MNVGYLLGATAGGTGEHVAMLADGSAAAGLTVTGYGPTEAGRRFFPRAVSAEGGEPGCEAEEPGAGGPALCSTRVRFVPVDIGDRPRPAQDAATVWRLRRLLAQSGHDLVHAHGMRAGALAALALAGTRRRPPLVVTVHNAPPPGGAATVIYGLLERIVASRADAVAWVSADLGARMARLGASDGGRALVPAPRSAPAPPAAVAAVRAELAVGGRPVVLAVGRLAAQKGFAGLIGAAARWQQRDPAPLLAIAGDGPLEAALREAAQQGRADVRFLGRRADVPALLAAADVVAVPSLWEGQPLVVQEALGAGRPIVATRVGGIPDLTGEDGALLVPPGDPEALASAVLAVLDSPAAAGRLAAAARSRAAALPMPADAVAAALALYRRLLA